MSFINTKNYNKQLLLSGILFTFHNVEEGIGTACSNYAEKLPAQFIPPRVQPMVWAIILIAWSIILRAIQGRSEYVKRNILTVLVLVFLVNAFVPHILGSIYIRSYFPALITSIVLYIPYSLWLLPKLYRQFTSLSKFFKVAVNGLLISIALVILLQLFTSRILFPL